MCYNHLFAGLRQPQRGGPSGSGQPGRPFGTRGSEVQILSPRPIIFKHLQQQRDLQNRPPGFAPDFTPHSSVANRINIALHAHRTVQDRLQNRLQHCDGKTRWPTQLQTVELKTLMSVAVASPERGFWGTSRTTSTVCRLPAHVDFRREMRPIAFVDPGAFVGTNPENARDPWIACRSGGISPVVRDRLPN